MVDKKRILIIDDDTTIIGALRLVLEDEGYVVDEASNGVEAIEKSFQGFYNLAIVDWRLPDIEGTNLLSRLKETVPKMAKIMLTGYPSMENAIDSVNAQADAFLQKPVRVELLLKKIDHLLKQQDEDRKFSEKKMTEYVQTRVNEIMVSKLNH